MTATGGMKEAIWLKGLVGELKISSPIVTLYCDNQSAIFLMKNPSYHEGSKHIDIKLHFVREVVSKGAVTVEKIPGEDNPADIS